MCKASFTSWLKTMPRHEPDYEDSLIDELDELRQAIPSRRPNRLSQQRRLAKRVRRGEPDIQIQMVQQGGETEGLLSQSSGAVMSIAPVAGSMRTLWNLIQDIWLTVLSFFGHQATQETHQASSAMLRKSAGDWLSYHGLQQDINHAEFQILEHVKVTDDFIELVQASHSGSHSGAVRAFVGDKLRQLQTLEVEGQSPEFRDQFLDHIDLRFDTSTADTHKWRASAGIIAARVEKESCGDACATKEEVRDAILSLGEEYQECADTMFSHGISGKFLESNRFSSQELEATYRVPGPIQSKVVQAELDSLRKMRAHRANTCTFALLTSQLTFRYAAPRYFWTLPPSMEKIREQVNILLQHEVIRQIKQRTLATNMIAAGEGQP
mmetsp:Transcript_126424/g.282554  ORF Transcript_126424/g.282554 Transcript_126424/m.282554 type:complete len:381 (+) Transcript_126424:2-1144(+)